MAYKHMKYTDDFEISVAKDSIEGQFNERLMRGAGFIDYNEHLALQRRVITKVAEIISTGKLPAIVDKMAQVNPAVWATEEIQPRIQAAINVLPNILFFINAGFHPRLVKGMLEKTLAEVAFGYMSAWVFERKFQRLYTDKDLCEQVWGLRDHVTLFVAKSILADIITGIDVDNPSEEDWKKSTTYDTAIRFKTE